MQAPLPEPEHQWLMQLVGEWDFEHSCDMGPDQPAYHSSGKQSTRAIGKIWIQGEMTGDVTDGEPSRSLITLGYDPTRKKFVGNFITSMMAHLWPYEGTLDEARKVLTLDSSGPSFSGEGQCRYQDSLEIIDHDHHVLSSQYQNPDGSWVKFMEGRYRRAK